ncbi:MAG: thioredoxin family protein [Phycisphaerae bacterium]
MVQATAERTGAAKKKPNWWTTFAVVGCVVVVLFVLSRPAKLSAAWGDDYDAALSAAAETDRRVLIAFHSAGCPPCAAMERMVIDTAVVRDALADFVPVRLDVRKNLAIATRYGVRATPTYVITDPDGHLVDGFEGYRGKDAFVGFLKHALTLPPHDTR